MKDKTIIGLLILAAVIILTGGILFGLFWGKGNAVPEQAVADTVPQRKVAETVPSFVSDALKNAPPDALVGIGTAKMASMSMSRTIATTRARAEIARQINQVVLRMVREYTAASDTDPSAAISFQEQIIVTISKAELSGTKVIEMDEDEEGNFWVVVTMEKWPVFDVITRSQILAKLNVPQMASFDPEALLPDAFESAVKTEITVGR
jgi:hypothetical protein